MTSPMTPSDAARDRGSSKDKARSRTAWLLDRGLTLSVVLGALLYVGFAAFGGFAEVKERLAEFALRTAALGLGLALLNYGLRFLKWQYYLWRLSISVPAGRSLGIFLSGFSLTVTPGKIGEVLKAYLLRESQGVKVSRSAPIVVAERVTDLIACLSLSVLGLHSFAGAPGMRPMLAVGASLVAGLMIGVGSTRLGGLLGRLSPTLGELHASTRALLAPAPLLVGTLLSILAWGCECAAFWVILGGFPGARADLFLCVFIYAATTVAGAVSFLPGGLGVQEGGMIKLLIAAAAQVDRPTAVAATFVTRLCTLWFAVLIGAVALVVVRRSVRVNLDEVAALKEGRH